MTLPHAWHALAQTLVGDPELTSREVAEAAGADLDQARRLWRALGFAPVPGDERIFSRSDVAMLRAVRALVQQGTAAPEVLMQLTRVIGQALSRVAEAQVAATASSGVAPDVVIAQTTALAPSIESFLAYAWRRHLLAALLHNSAAERREATGEHGLTVGFADMVGFTPLSQQLSEGELAAVVDRFEALAYEHIPERGGRVVKMIGDEVMFAVDDGVVAAEIALALVEACGREESLPEIRVGLAMGPTVSWEGDLYGPTVNLASRLVNIARPSTVLASEELGKLLEGSPAFQLRHLRALKLKGIGRVGLWVLRRAGAGTSAKPA
jgi:adenylate cyclase